MYAHDVEAVEEVFAERAPPHSVVQIDVRQRQEPRVHANRLASAQPLELAPLDDAQQLRLRVARQVRYLVQDERALVRRFDAGALAALGAYDFPGNVRELANVVERAVIVSDGREVGAKDLPEAVLAAAGNRARRERRPTLAELEDEYIREVLAASRGNKSEAARVLGISRKNLYERLARQRADGAGEKPVTDG